MIRRLEFVIACLIVLAIFYFTPLKYWLLVIIIGACLRGLVYVFHHRPEVNKWESQKKKSNR